jgi:TetR/AcrR family transcriptional regulator
MRRAGRPKNPVTRLQLVAMARSVFATRGVDGVSLREVAELAGIRKASLLHHFESKQALYEAVLEDTLSKMLELIGAARLDEGDFLERLDRLGALVTEYFASHPETARLLVRELIGEGAYLDDPEGRQRVQQVLELTAAFLEAGMDSGAFARSDPRQLALSIAGLHLLPYSAWRASETFLGGKLGSSAQIAARIAAVLPQVRALCLAPAQFT